MSGDSLTTTDRIVSWFLRRAVIPRVIALDTPGFVTERVEKQIDIRNVVVPEGLLAGIEAGIVEHARDGRQRLYSVGKRFGYRHALISGLPVLEGGSALQRRKFLAAAGFMIRYIGSVYASNIEHTVDLEAETLTVRMRNYVVCPRSGIGLLLSAGGIAGMWAYAVQDRSVEGVQVRCEGRGDPRCEVVCGPAEVLKERGYEVGRERELDGLGLEEEYMDFNAPRPLQYARTSVQDMIDLGVFQYRKGVLAFGNERHFICGACLPYMLETEFEQSRKLRRVLEAAAFRHGQQVGMAASGRDWREFVPEYLAACGWGDTLLSGGRNVTATVHWFPWTAWAERVRFTIFRAFLEGTLSAMQGTRIRFPSVAADSKGDGLALLLG